MPTDKLIIETLAHGGYVDLVNCYRIVASLAPEAPPPGMSLLQDTSGPYARLNWRKGRWWLLLDDGGGHWADGADWMSPGGPGTAALHEHEAIADALRRVLAG